MIIFLLTVLFWKLFFGYWLWHFRSLVRPFIATVYRELRDLMRLPWAFLRGIGWLFCDVWHVRSTEPPYMVDGDMEQFLATMIGAVIGIILLLALIAVTLLACFFSIVAAT